MDFRGRLILLLKSLAVTAGVVALIAVVALAYFGLRAAFYSQDDDAEHLAAKQTYLERISALGATGPRPNIVFVLYDDLGRGDLGPGSPPQIATPYIDGLADRGVSLENFYAPAPVCTPSRAGFLTGRLPPRAGLTTVAFPTGSTIDLVGKALSDEHVRLPAEEITLGEVLKAAGYTTGMVGKWHLGDRSPSLPNDMGFDSFFGSLYSNDMEPFALYRDREIEVPAPADQTRLSELYADETTAFINDHAGGPFFLYLAHNFPHIPLYVREARLGRSGGGLYGDVLEELDDGIGQLLAALDRNGVRRDTLIILTSDNGPWYEGSPAGLRGRKGETFEGGMQVPFIAHWPGRVEGGFRTSAMAMGTDLLPTILDWLDLPAPDDRLLDGRSIADMLERGSPSPHEVLYYYDSRRLRAVRDGRFKFHGVRKVIYAPEYLPFSISPEQGPWLFDLIQDPEEAYDASARFPEEVERLADRFAAREKEMAENPRGWR